MSPESVLPDLPAGSDPRLGTLTVAVIGAGHVGAELIRNLARLGVGRVDLYERDPATARSVPVSGAAHVGDFWDELTLRRLRGYDFAVCTINDPTARSRMNQKCLVANVNLMLAGAGGTRAVVGAYPFAALANAGCYECGRTSRPDMRHRELASLRLTMGDDPGVPPASPAQVAAAIVAGGLAAAMLVRIAAGVGGFVSRRALFDTAQGTGSSVEIERDTQCPRCRDLERPVPIVRTRNRWDVPAHVQAACPEALDHDVELSDEIDGEPGRSSFRLGELAARFQGGPIPAKFALTMIEGRSVCLDFEETRDVGQEAGAAGAAPTPAGGAGGDPSNS